MFAAIAGMGIGSVMGFMGAQSANAAAIAAYNQAARQTIVKRKWINDRMKLQHRQSGIKRAVDVMAVEKQRLAAVGRNRAGAAAMGKSFSGTAIRKRDMINVIDAGGAHRGVAMAANKMDRDIEATAFSQEFAAVQTLNNTASQLNSTMKDPMMSAIETGLSMGQTTGSIGNSISPTPSSPGGTVNNYGINYN